MNKNELVEEVLKSIPKAKMEWDSNMMFGPFSTIAIKIGEDYRLHIEKKTIYSSKWWSLSSKLENHFFLKTYELDKTFQITKEDFIFIHKKLEKIDTDSVEYFLNDIKRYGILK